MPGRESASRKPSMISLAATGCLAAASRLQRFLRPRRFVRSSADDVAMSECVLDSFDDRRTLVLVVALRSCATRCWPSTRATRHSPPNRREPTTQPRSSVLGGWSRWLVDGARDQSRCRPGHAARRGPHGTARQSCGADARAARGVRIAWHPEDVFVCENPIVVRAAQRALGTACRPLVSTGGWPSAAASALLDQLRAGGATLRHHGDFDWDGLAIHQALVRDAGVMPWRYDAATYNRAVQDSHALLRLLPPAAVPSAAPLRKRWPASAVWCRRNWCSMAARHLRRRPMFDRQKASP